MKPVSLRKCKKCERDKPLSDFPIYCREPERRRHECNRCLRVRMNNHYYDNVEDRRAKTAKRYAKAPSRGWTPEQKQRRQETQREVTDRMRSLVYHQYGNRCSCCGEDNPLFLTIDHVNNDGHKLRSQHGMSSTLYRWIIKNDFPIYSSCSATTATWARRETREPALIK